ncbi:MAG: serine/threonine-protein kinase [Sorangiineae bacterium]|nr:serine/threonine-protein kinase [Polyangiaceae bacterium]MEB2323219.1 serine/threonine-protein kinase [Sorangiineae bacterium]
MSGSLESPLASTPASSPPDARVGTVLAERYRIDALLGEGGMGRVYAGEHVLLRKRLAIKVLHRELTSVPEVVARFEREAMAAANIDHPNVAAATDVGKLPDGAVYLVLEYVQGVNLRDELAKGPMPAPRALHIARQIAAALASAHALDIVHRDLKPENVMLVEKGSDRDFVKVLDFGIAKVPLGAAGADGDARRPITKVGMVFGTPEYMAPEQALGQPVDGRADLYSLGIILYELLCGLRPFASKSQVAILGQQLSKPVPRFAERAPGVLVPPQVEQVVRRLLAKDAAERVPSALELILLLDALLGLAPPESGRLLTLAAGSPGVYGSAPEIILTDLPSEPLRTLPGLGSSPPSLSGVSATAPAVSASPGTPRGRLYAWVERRRAALPPALRGPLAQVPAPALLAVTTALTLAVGVGLAAGVVALAARALPASSAPASRSAVASASAPLAASVAPLTAPASEVAAAREQGAAELAALSARFPKDAKLLIDSSKAYLLERRHPEAVDAISRALALAPALAADEQVASTLWMTAQSKESADSAFHLLEGPMGARGADILYDLLVTKGIARWVKERAEAALETDALERKASPALAAALALRFAATCAERHALLPRVKEVGDKRSLAYLRLYQSHAGCGPRKNADCNPCMRKDDVLAQVIDEVSQRERR